MKTLLDYLNKTESATKKLLEGINSYIAIVGTPPVFTTDSTGKSDEEVQKEREDWFSANKDRLDEFRENSSRYFEETFAENVLCGSLLQIASMGIRLFSKNKNIRNIPKGFTFSQNDEPAKYCIGRFIRNVPIGLIIYAARNQYNHLNDVCELRATSAMVFEKLCQAEDFGISWRDDTFDPASEPSDISGNTIASNVILLLEWRTYESYFNDMVEMEKQM